MFFFPPTFGITITYKNIPPPRTTDCWCSPPLLLFDQHVPPVHSGCAFVRPHFKWLWCCCHQCQQMHDKFLVSIYCWQWKYFLGWESWDGLKEPSPPHCTPPVCLVLKSFLGFCKCWWAFHGSEGPWPHNLLLHIPPCVLLRHHTCLNDTVSSVSVSLQSLFDAGIKDAFLLYISWGLF